jgi:uncharacterized membrane protein
MKTFSIEEAFNKAWGLWKQHKELMTVVAVLTLLVGGIGGGHRHYYEPSYIVVLFLALDMFIKLGIIKIGLKVIDGVKTDWNEMFRHGNLFISYLFTSIVYGIGVAIGFVFLIIPGFYVMLKYMFAPIIVVDKNVGIMESFKMSAKMTDGVKWKLLGLIILAILMNILGAIVFFVGLLVSIPVSTLAFLYVYRKLSD